MSHSDLKKGDKVTVTRDILGAGLNLVRGEIIATHQITVYEVAVSEVEGQHKEVGLGPGSMMLAVPYVPRSGGPVVFGDIQKGD